jgi:hypothetical protein
VLRTLRTPPLRDGKRDAVVVAHGWDLTDSFQKSACAHVGFS